MRIAAYSDVEYHRDRDGAVYAGESFVVFVAHLARFAERLVLLGRLAPSPGRSHYRLPPEVDFAPLPHYSALSRPWAAATAMARSLRRFWKVLDDVDAVWLLGPHPLALLFCLLARMRRRRVVLGVRQDFPAHMRTRHPARRDLHAAAHALEGAWRLLARRLPVVVVGPDLARHYPGPATLPIVISVVDENNAVSVEQALARDYAGELTVLSVGRMDPEKNPLLLVEVLRRLRERSPRWRLVACGDGTMREDLRRELDAAGLSEHAELPGFLTPDSGLSDLYRSSHVLLHVSWTEGVPQVRFEAYAAGLLVVTTAVGGVPEVAGDAALQIPPGDADAAADAVARIAREPDLRRDLVTTGLASLERHSLDSECRRVADLLAGSPQRSGASDRGVSGLLHRQSWVWAVLPEDAHSVHAEGDPALAAVLDATGYRVVDGREGPTDAVLIDVDGDSAAAAAGAAARGDSPVIAVAVAGGGMSAPEPVAIPVRVLQLLASPVQALGAAGAAWRVERALAADGLRTFRMATGDRSRKYGIGARGWRRRRRVPLGWVVAGFRTRRPSLLERAVEEAAGALGKPLTWDMGTVFESGKLIVDLSDRDGHEYVLRIAAGPSKTQLVDSLDAVSALAQAANQTVVTRLAVPIVRGEVGPAHYALEPRAQGSPPLRMTDDLWRECTEFLVALHRTPIDARSVHPEPSPATLVERIVPFAGATASATLERLVPELERRLDGLPRGKSHGDFWNQNLMTQRGHLSAVLDWDWAARDALPVLDLFDMIALSARRSRDLPPGERFLTATWPLARRGGDVHVAGYCRALGLPADTRTLEGLAVAYWLDRVSRDLRPFSSRPGRANWLAENVEAPLSLLAREGW